MFEETENLSEPEPPSYIDAHTHSWTDDDSVIRIHNIYPDAECEKNLPKRFCIGIHPDIAEDGMIGTEIESMRRILGTAPGVLAVGECGLDHFSRHPMSMQEDFFIKQVELAVEHDLPVVIHAVRTWPDIIRIKNKYAPKALWLAHGFRSSQEIAEDLIRHNIMLSFGASLLKDERNREVLAELPEEWFLFETDEEADPVTVIYEEAAGIRECSIAELRVQTAKNFNRLFPKHALELPE